MWICFDCEKVNAGMKCKREHRCLNIDMRSWRINDLLVFVNNVVYTIATYDIIEGGKRIWKVEPMDYALKDATEIKAKGKIKVINYGLKEVKYVMLTEQEWKLICKKAEEIRYYNELEKMNIRLAMIYSTLIKKGRISSRDYAVKELKKGIEMFGDKYVKELRKKIEGNEWTSKKMKEKVLKMLLG